MKTLGAFIPNITLITPKINPTIKPPPVKMLNVENIIVTTPPSVKYP
jgi:hypothetical protein